MNVPNLKKFFIIETRDMDTGKVVNRQESPALTAFGRFAFRKPAGNMPLMENVIIERRDHWTGEVLDHEEISNLIANAGKERVARRLLKDATEDGFDYIAIGEGTTAAAAGDTGLENETTRAQADNAGDYEADYKAIFEKTFTFGSGESYSITEAAISDSSSASGEAILNRLVFTAKDVDADTDLYIKITITVS